MTYLFNIKHKFNNTSFNVNNILILQQSTQTLVNLFSINCIPIFGSIRVNKDKEDSLISLAPRT